MKSEKPMPMIVEKQKEGVLIQVQEKRRGRDGRMTFRKSKSLTVYNLTIDKAYQRISELFTKPSGAAREPETLSTQHS